MTSSLTPAERITRQRSDQLMLAALDDCSAPIYVTGHRTAEDVRANRDPVPVGSRIPPAHYRVVYDFDTLRAPGSRQRPTIVHVAPLVSGDYPTSQPSAWVISDFVPWTPHFAADVPICHGDHAWIPNRTQLVDYVVHIGKLLNFDEPAPVPGYHGYNSQAIEYWQTKMHLQPLDPGLRLPTIRPEEVIRERGRMRRAQVIPPPASRFRAARSEIAANTNDASGRAHPRFAPTLPWRDRGPGTVPATRPRFARAPGGHEPGGETSESPRPRFAPAGGTR